MIMTPFVMKGAESEQPVGAPCYQWMGCRDHAGITCFPYSGSWQAQGENVFFYDIGPLICLCNA